ncbi:MAG: EamA family transporter [Ignavibacteria bacterium]|nr:EamA family transporter [Ignavibacteria bacterium]
MIYLLIVSFIWAFSFGLIKVNLSGIDANLVSFIRLSFSFLSFLPFLRIKGLNLRISGLLFLTGIIQFGLMYIFYLNSFQFLKAYEVALFTILTPLYVTLFNDIFNKKFNSLFFVTSLLAIIGAGIILYSTFNYSEILSGFILVQLSNICFAFGQIFYVRIIKSNNNLKDHQVFPIIYLGAAAITFLITLSSGSLHFKSINCEQWLTLVYLGIVASGLSFFLWNYGAKKTNTGILAVFNNLKTPLAILVSVLFFNENADLVKLILGLFVLITAIIINQKFSEKSI